MITSGLLSYDVDGRVRVTFSPPTHFTEGIPFNGILLSINGAALAYHDQGLPFAATHQLRITGGGAPVAFSAGGLGISNTDGICIVTGAGPITKNYHMGLPFTNGGQLICNNGETPAQLFAFNAAFNSAFDSENAP